MESSEEPPSPGHLFFFVPFILFASSFPGLLIGIAFLLILLLCSALISGSEVAYFSLNPSDVQALSENENPNAKRILRLKEKPRILLATILIANNLINIAIIILSDILLRSIFSLETFHKWALKLSDVPGFGSFESGTLAKGIEFFLTVFVATFLLVLFGEVAPKIYANINNKKMALFTARPLMFLRTSFSPLSKVLVGWSSWFERKIASDTSHNRSKKDELDKAIELTVSHEQNSEKEIDLLKSIVKFGEVTTKQIMRSRVDVVAIDVTSSFEEVLKTVMSSGFSRIPVFEDDFDHVKGILYVKDLLIHLDKKNKSFKWQKLVRTEVKYVPEAKKINELLNEFQQERNHMAIVVDEFGGSGGLVTLEDVMEEVIGDIRDEFDDQVEIEYEQIDPYNFIFEGKTLLNDMCRLVGIDTDTFDKDKGDADSIAGLLLELIGKIPQKNSEIRYMKYRFKILAVNAKRIEKIQISLPSPVKA